MGAFALRRRVGTCLGGTSIVLPRALVAHALLHIQDLGAGCEFHAGVVRPHAHAVSGPDGAVDLGRVLRTSGQRVLASGCRASRTVLRLLRPVHAGVARRGCIVRTFGELFAGAVLPNAIENGRIAGALTLKISAGSVAARVIGPGAAQGCAIGLAHELRAFAARGEGSIKGSNGENKENQSEYSHLR